MKKLLKLITILLMLSLTVVPALAASTDVTDLTLTINAGSLDVTSDLSASLNAVTVSTSNQSTYTGAGSGNDTSDVNVVASDTRGETTPSGWDLTANVDDMVNGNDVSKTIDVTNFTNNFSSVTTNSGSSTGISAGTGAALVDTDDDGTSDSFSVMTASSGNGQGEYELYMGLDLTVPANTPAGPYTSDVDLSIS